jgi:hypothetical protein
MISHIEPQFLNDVEKHQMKILKNDGLYRHLRFIKSESSSYWFDIVTWPNNLCVTGDMGTYTFSRIEDMFKFFILDKNDWNYSEAGIPINPSYWSEKIKSYDSQIGIKRFSLEKFERLVREYYEEFISEEDITEDSKDYLWEEINDTILYSENSYEASKELFEFSKECETNDGKIIEFTFGELYQTDFSDYTYHYIWCLLAVVWGIRKFNEENI